jgi:hypothetical protein
VKYPELQYIELVNGAFICFYLNLSFDSLAVRDFVYYYSVYLCSFELAKTVL